MKETFELPICRAISGGDFEADSVVVSLGSYTPQLLKFLAPRLPDVRLPQVDRALAQQIARMVAAIRKEELRKTPGVAETLDWAATLAGLGVSDLQQAPEAVFETLICLLKTQEDRARVTREVTGRLLGKVA